MKKCFLNDLQDSINTGMYDNLKYLLFFRLSMTESELALQEQRTHDVEVIVDRLKQELTQKSSSHNDDLRKEREVQPVLSTINCCISTTN